MTNTQTKPRYQRNVGTQYKPRIVVIPQNTDICAVCGFSIGSKKYSIMPNGDIIHDRDRCRNRYKVNLTQ